MNAKSITSVLFALCMTGPVVAGQVKGTDAKPATSSYAAKKPMATASEISVAVTGLTAENQSKVKTALSALTEQVYVCPDCKAESMHAGTCKACKQELKAEQLPVLDKTEAMVDSGMLRFALRPERTLSMNELDGILRKSSVSVDNAKTKLPGASTIVLTGLTEEQLPAIEKAMLDSKLFSTVHAKLDAKTKEVRIHAMAASTAPSRSAVEALVAQSSLHPRLSDIILGGSYAPRG